MFGFGHSRSHLVALAVQLPVRTPPTKRKPRNEGPCFACCLKVNSMRYSITTNLVKHICQCCSAGRETCHHLPGSVSARLLNFQFSSPRPFAPPGSGHGFVGRIFRLCFCDRRLGLQQQRLRRLLGGDGAAAPTATSVVDAPSLSGRGQTAPVTTSRLRGGTLAPDERGNSRRDGHGCWDPVSSSSSSRKPVPS